jgi:WD40 repeat protein
MEDFLDKVVPVLQKLLRKLSFLSNSLETDMNLGDEVKSKLLLFCLSCQIEAISSTSSLLLFRPSLVGDFLVNDSMRFIRPYMTPKSPMFLNPTVSYEVYFLRALGVIRLCGMGQTTSDSTFNYGRWVDECVETLQALEPLIHFIMDNALLESSTLAHIDTLSKGSDLKISCSCPTKLGVKLPSSGVYPWNEDTSSAAQYISFMSGNELESDVALTESIAQYWRIRSNSLPTNQSYLFDPTKSFLGTRIERARSLKADSNPMELIEKLVSSKSYQVLFDVILLFQSSVSYMSLCEATLEPLLNCVNVYKASTIPGITLMQSLFRFLLRSMEQNPEATISASRSTELWKKVLDVLLPGGRPEYDKTEISSKLHRFLVLSGEESTQLVYIQDRKTSRLQSTDFSVSVGDEDSEEETTFKLQLLTIDCALELLWLFSSQKLIFSMEHSDSPFQDHLEEQILVECLKTSPSNFSVMLISRWLCNYAILHSRMAIKSPFWLDAVLRVNLALRNLVDQGQRALLQPDTDIFLWPATYSCLRLLGKILYDSISTNWLDAFLFVDGIPNFESGGQKESLSVIADSKLPKRRITAHIVFFRTTQFLDCRNFSVGLIMRLMYAAAREFTSRSNAASLQDSDYRHLCQSLFDDIVKYILNMIRNHHLEPFPESHLASIGVLFEGLKVLIKQPDNFSLVAEHKLTTQDLQQLFVRYGPARIWHKYYYAWTKSRPPVIKDWLLCLESMLLVANQCPEACFELILCSVPFITALIDKNDKLQEIFFSSAQSKKRLNGSESGESHRHELCILIFSSLPGKEEESTVFFSPLFEMLMGGLPAHIQKLLFSINKRIDSGKSFNILEGDNKLSIEHEFVLQILIPLLPCWSEEWQVFTLETAIHLLQGTWTSVSNLLKVTSMKPSLLELVLEVFHYLAWKAKKVAIRLLKQLGRFSVSVAELKKLIRCLKDKDEVAAESSADFLADILSSSMSASVDPQFYFHFEGKQSGIRLPLFQKWPGITGFSFATWFAVDWAASNSAEMTLLHMRQQDGVGFEIFLRNDKGTLSNSIEVAYAVYTGKDVEPVEETIANFRLNNVLEKWHFIGFSHCKGRKFLKKSHIQLILDQELSAPIDFTFPRMTNIVTHGCIGSSNPITSTKLSFHGQMSSVYFFSQALPVKALQQLQMLTFRRFHEVSSITEGNRDLGFDSSISDSLVLAYNPGVESNGILLNNIPDILSSQFGVPLETESGLDAIGLKGHMNGILLEGTYVSTSSDIRNALDSLGGIKVILPMFERLEFSGNSRSQHALLCQMLRLITNALNNSVETRRFMIQSGFSCLRYLLEKCDPSVLQASIIEELQKLQEKFEGDEQWNTAIFLTLYVDFSLWIKTQFSTQDRVLLEIEKFCRQRTHFVHQKCLIKRLMQSIYITYSPDAAARIREIGKSEQFQNFQKHSIIGTLMDTEILTLRSRILNTVSSLMSGQGSINEENISSIISYIVFESNPHHKIEGILLLMKLINPEKPKVVPALLNAFTTTKILISVSHLCGLPRAKVRMHSWMLLCSILHIGLQTESVLATKSQQLSESLKKQYAEAETVEGTHETPQVAQMFGLDSHALAAVLMNSVRKSLDAMSQGLIDTELGEYEFSVIFHLLLTTMFGFSTKYIIQSLEQVPMSHQDSSHHHTDEESASWTGEIPPSMSVALRGYKISIPMIFPALLEMLSFKHCSPELRMKLFDDMMECIHSCDNVDIVLGIPHWQTLFLNFYLAVCNESNYVETPGAFRVPEMFSSVIAKSIAHIHLFAIQFGEPKSLTYKVCPRGPATLHSYMDMSTLELFDIMRKDQRALGCAIVKKTVGYLRAFVTKGLLLYDGFTFLVINSTLEVLVQTILALKNANMERIEKEMRFKIIEMNVWFLLEIFCQFLIMPPMHPILVPAKSENNKFATQSQSAKLKLSPTELRRSTSDQISHITNNYSLGIEDVDKSVPAVITRIRSATSHDVGSNKILFESTSGSDKSNYREVNHDNSLPIISDVAFEDSTLPRLADLQVDEINIDFPFAGLSVNSYEDSFWMIIESLLSLLGVNDSAQGSWVSRDRLLRLEAAIKVGINRGRFVVSLVQDSMEALLSSESDGQVLDIKGDRESKNTKGQQKLFVDRVIDNSLWLLLRAILNLALEGNAYTGDLKEDSISVKAILKLAMLLNWSRSATKNNLDSESLFILARFSKLIDSSKLDSDSLWSKFVLKLLIEIIVSKKSIIIARLEPFVSSSGGTSTAGGSLKASASQADLPSLTKASSPRSPGDYSNDIITTPEFSNEEIGRKRTNSNISDIHSSMNFCDYLLNKINEYLEKARNCRITWRQWMSVMNEVIKEAAVREKAAVASTLDDMGFHKQTEDISNQWEVFQHHVTMERERMESKADALVHKIYTTEIRLLKEFIRSDFVLLKKCETNWNSLRDELCNERGPWGSGSWDDDEVSWKVDSTEETLRMHRKLVRSGVLKSYLKEFLARNQKNSEEEASPSQSVKERQQTTTLESLISASDDSAEGVDGNELSKLGFNLSILRDLHQYRAESESQSGQEVLDADIEDTEEGDTFGQEESLSASDATPLSTPCSTGLNVELSDLALFDSSDQEENDIIFSALCEVITPSTNSMTIPSTGLLQITRKKVIFTKSSELTTNVRSSFGNMQNLRQRRDESVACEGLWACQQFPTSSWDVTEICNVLLRYYQLRFVAAELFFTSRRVVFFNLMDPKAALKFHNTLRALKPPNIAPFLGRRPFTIIAKTLSANSLQPLSEAWANREISNFEYLMRLNTIAGRTYNDLGQYPIFPWVLSDYTSETLDLKNPASFRDFRWPIGAQEKKQREILISKYNDLVQNYDPDDEISLPPFHYGTHYSVAGFVVWYLMRCEPYTSLHVQLQDGRIDRADRLFDSIAAAWRGCTTNPSDAKELIPELFYNPDILVNINEVDFGTTQGHRKVDHITLPPWAKDPNDFIIKHRDALESEYVSRHLHHWIDLVFGYKQRPPHIPGGSEAAVEACNVFFHLTYENAVDLEKLRDSNPELYYQYVCQITEFGQTPCQLFFKDHVQRAPLNKVDIIWPIASIVRGVHTVYEKEDSKFGRPSKMLCYKSTKISYGPVVMIVDADDKLLTVDHNRVLGIHTWQVNSQDAVPPFRLKIDPHLAEIAKGDSSNILAGLGLVKGGNGRERKIGVPFAPDRSKATKAIQRRAKDDSIITRSHTDNGKETISKFRPVKIKTFEREERNIARQIRPLSTQVGQFDGDLSPLTVKAILSPLATSNISIISHRSERIAFTSDPSHESSGVSKGSSSNESTPVSRIRSRSIHSAASASKQRRYSHASSSSASGAAVSTPASAGSVSQPAPVTMMNMNIFSSSMNSKVQDEHVTGRVFAFLQEASLLFSCGHWDWSVRVTSAENGKLLQILSQHHDVVTCLAVAKDHGSRWLVTGSRDCTIIVWDIIVDRNQLISVHPIRTLYGHDETVTCVAIHPELDLIISGSDDGTWISHNLRDGKYIRTMGNYEVYPKWWNNVVNRPEGASRATAGVKQDAIEATPSFQAGPKEQPVGRSGHTIPQISTQRAVSDQSVPVTVSLKPSPSETDLSSISTKEDSAGDSSSTLQSNDATAIMSPFQSIKAPIVTTPRRVVAMPPLSFEPQLSPGDDGVSSVVHGGSSFFSFERPATTTPSLHPDALLSDGQTLSATPGETSNINGVHQNNSSASNAVTTAALGRGQFWSVTWVGISKEGYIVTYSAEHQRLATFTISGTFIASKKVPEALYAFALSGDGMVLVTGGSACLITFRWVHTLELANDGPRHGLEAILDGSTADYQIDVFPSPIRSIHLTRQERHLLVGLETGELRILAHDPDYLRERLHRKLQELGIL